MESLLLEPTGFGALCVGAGAITTAILAYRLSMGAPSCSCVGQVDLPNMLRLTDSGDIVLFMNPNAVTYVGMILKYTDNPEETILIESIDCGVFMGYAKDRLEQVLQDPGHSVVGWRQLQPRQLLMGPWKKKLHQAAERLMDLPYEQNFSDFVQPWVQRDSAYRWIVSCASGSRIEDATNGEDLNSIFSAELAVYLLNCSSLLDTKQTRDSNAYAPRDFASNENAYINLKHPFALHQEVQVVHKLDNQLEVAYAYHAHRGASEHKSVKSLIDASEASRDMHANCVLEMAIYRTECKIKDQTEAGNETAELEKTLNELKRRR